MKKRKTGWITVIYLLGAAYSAVFAVSVYSNFWSIILFIAGGALCYMLGAAMHEAGHILASKIFGFKVVGYSIGCITVDKKSGRKITLAYSDYAGETEVVPIRDGNFKNRYFAVIAGGLFGGFLSCVLIGALYFVFSFNELIAALFITFPLVTAWFIINLVPKLVPNSDGSFLYLLCNEDSKSEVEKYLKILYRLNKGETFSEMDGALFDAKCGDGFLSEEILTARLMRAEEEENFAVMKECLQTLAMSDNLLEDTEKELLFAACVLNDGNAVERFKRVLPLCDAADDLRSQRALIAHADFFGDENYVAIAKPSAIKSAREWYLKGEGRFTEIVLQRYIK